MEKQTFAVSLATGRHQQLSKLAGNWAGTTKTWFDPSVLEDESTVTGTITVLLGGRFIRHEYKSQFKNEPLEGACIYGYHLGSDKVQSSWIDSMHTSLEILQGEGEWLHNGFHYTCSYFAGADQPRWHWKTIVEIIQEDELLITAYNISPGGEESKALETVYHRK